MPVQVIFGTFTLRPVDIQSGYSLVEYSSGRALLNSITNTNTLPTRLSIPKSLLETTDAEEKVDDKRADKSEY
jgi:hypothetical protein